MDYIAFDDLEDRINVGERFLIYLFFSPIDDIFSRLFSGGEKVLYNEGFIGELVEIFIREFRRLRLAFVYLLGL
ncbi:MAG: hypothetical protein JW765_12070 [Deltaproteobacteria bacterium]|nr:hypothetical protein [Candidatus Zymogenaceae bacterium]